MSFLPPARQRQLTGLFVVLVVLDLAYSGYQHFVLPIDGDLVAITAPAPWYSQVLNDPLGLGVLLRNEVYSSPNRYFAHATMALYYRCGPFLLRSLFVKPLDSVYLANDLVKIALQAGLLYVLTRYATGGASWRSFRFWLTAVLITPFFQTYGYGNQMNVIDQSPTYAFFYALPHLLLLVWLWPFYAAAYRSEPVALDRRHGLGLVLLAGYLALHGPTIPGVVGLLFPGVLLEWSWRQWRATRGRPPGLRLREIADRVPRQSLWLSVWFGGLVLYSLYIGRNNAENLAIPMPLGERYSLLLLGIADMFKGSPGWWILALAGVINAALLRWSVPATRERQWLLRSAQWLAIFTVVYIAVTPLGGFRPYRAHILRYDLISPLTLALMALYGASAAYLLRALAGRWQTGYVAFVVGLAGLYWAVDVEDWRRGAYFCERKLIKQLAAAQEPIVVLPAGCTLMAWQPIEKPYFSESGAQMLYLWGITDQVRYYYQAP